MTRRAWSAAEIAIVAAAPDTTTAHTELHAAGHKDRTFPAVAKKRHRLTMKAGRQAEASDAPRSSCVAYWPTYPKATREALSALAERAAREGMTTAQYEREQARILGGQA